MHFLTKYDENNIAKATNLIIIIVYERIQKIHKKGEKHMFKKLDGMLVRKKMITGYLIVIVLMAFSGILAIVGETILLRNLSNYSNKVQRLTQPFRCAD